MGAEGAVRGGTYKDDPILRFDDDACERFGSAAGRRDTRCTRWKVRTSETHAEHRSCVSAECALMRSFTSLTRTGFDRCEPCHSQSAEYGKGCAENVPSISPNAGLPRCDWQTRVVPPLSTAVSVGSVGVRPTNRMRRGDVACSLS